MDYKETLKKVKLYSKIVLKKKKKQKTKIVWFRVLQRRNTTSRTFVNMEGFIAAIGPHDYGG